MVKISFTLFYFLCISFLFIAPPTSSPLRSPSDKNTTVTKPSIPVTTNQRARSVSTESDASSEEVTTSGKSTPTQQTAGQVAAAVRFYFSFSSFQKPCTKFQKVSTIQLRDFSFIRISFSNI